MVMRRLIHLVENVHFLSKAQAETRIDCRTATLSHYLNWILLFVAPYFEQDKHLQVLTETLNYSGRLLFEDALRSESSVNNLECYIDDSSCIGACRPTLIVRTSAAYWSVVGIPNR